MVMPEAGRNGSGCAHTSAHTCVHFRVVCVGRHLVCIDNSWMEVDAADAVDDREIL